MGLRLPDGTAGRRWRLLVAVAVGGLLGGALRAAAGVAGAGAVPGWAVLVLVNVLGSLAMGAAVARGGRWASPALTVGLLGGFTTFAGWALDVVDLLSTAPLLALALALSVPVASTGACVAGLALGRPRAGGALP